MTCPMNPKACPMNPDGCPIHPFNTLRSLKAYYSIYMSLNTLDLPPFDRVLNTLQCDVHCGHPMRRQPVISEFKVAISKKCPMNPGFTLRRYRLNFALWYSPPKVNFSSSVFSSLVISRQLTDTYIKKSSKIKFMGEKLLRCKFLVLCFFESLCPLNVLSYFLTDQISPVGQLNMTFIA